MSETLASIYSLRQRMANLWIRFCRDSDVIAVVSLFGITLITRLPFSGAILYHWDSINFALALEQFDVASGQPHIPGYLLYVLLGRGVNLIFQDAQHTFVTVSAIGSALAVTMLYFLGKRIYDQRTGVYAALFLAFSPLYWFYGCVALPHSLDAFIVIFLVYLMVLILQGRQELAIPAAIALGIAGGFRPQTEVFLLPLVIYAGTKLERRMQVQASTALVFTNLAWLIPLLWMSGGIASYLSVMRDYTIAFNQTTSVFMGGGIWGVQRNLLKIGMYTLYAWGAAILLAMAAIVKLLRKPQEWAKEAWRDFRWKVYTLWILPPLVYYVLVHMGQQGLVFVYLPALLLLSAAGLNYLPTRRWVSKQGITAGVIMANAAIFLFVPTFPLGGNGFKLTTLDTLKRHEESYLTKIEEIHERFPPEQTVILSAEWRFMEYYLPEFPRIPYEIGSRWEVNEGQPELSSDVWFSGAEMGLAPSKDGKFTLILFEKELKGFIDNPDLLQVTRLDNSNMLYNLTFDARQQIHLSPHGLTIEERY